MKKMIVDSCKDDQISIKRRSEGFKLTVLTKNQWLFATVAGSKKKAAPCRP